MTATPTTLRPGDVDLADADALLLVGIPPHEYLDVLRREAPVHWNPPPPDSPVGARTVTRGFWVLSKHADVSMVSRDAQRFSSWLGSPLLFDIEDLDWPGGIDIQRTGLMAMDPPDHTAFRRLVQAGFTPRSVAKLEPTIETHARAIVAGLAASGSAEFVFEAAAELPSILLCELMGVPQEEREQYFTLGNEAANIENPAVDAPTLQLQLFEMCDRLVREKRAHPDDTMISRYANGVVDGRQLTDFEISMFFVTLSIAGHETTRNSTAHFVRLMDQHPDQRALLLEDLDGRLPNAIEEVLRYSPPVVQFRRTATADVELRGTTISAGDKVYLSYPSANRDEEVFDDPHRFDILRPNASSHLSFGVGPHFCIGASLARMQLRCLLRELYRVVPGVELTEPPAWMRSVWFNGLASMPVRVVPAGAVAG